MTSRPSPCRTPACASERTPVCRVSPAARISGRLGIVLTVPARLLGDSERGAVARLLDRDPYAGAQVAEQVSAYGLAWWRTEARVFGYGPHRELESLCWLGSNLIPV